MDKPTVSIAMPAYNAARFIGESIGSALAQTLSDFELVIVNDGSTDGTLKAIEAFQDARIHVLSQQNRGSGLARGRAMRAGRADFVAFLDADDLWEPQMLQACVDVLRASPQAGLVHTNWRYMDEDGHKSGRPTRWEPWRGNVLERLILRLPFITPGVVVKREALSRAGLLDESVKIVDDWDMWLLLALSGCYFECIERPLVYYRRHDANITHDHDLIHRYQKGVLDRFFARSDIPQRIRDRQRQAYGRMHLEHAHGLLRAGQNAEATGAMEQALSLDPALLLNRETYFAVAASRRPLGAHAQQVDMDQAEENVSLLLEAARAVGLGSRAVSFQACQALSQMAYWQGQGGVARHWMLRALAASPDALFDRQAAQWGVRTLVGSRWIRGIAAFFGRPPGPADGVRS